MHPFSLIPIHAVVAKAHWYSSTRTFLYSALTLMIGVLAMLVIYWDALAEAWPVVLAQINTHPVVDTVWPTSVAGWIGIAISTITFCAIIWHAVKKPGEVAAQAVEDRLMVRLDKINDTVAVFRADTERAAVEFRAGLERERQECSSRLDEIRKGFKERDDRLNVMENNWTQSREDRRHLAQSMTELRDSIAKWREEDRARDDRMLEALVRLKGGAV